MQSHEFYDKFRAAVWTPPMLEITLKCNEKRIYCSIYGFEMTDWSIPSRSKLCETDGSGTISQRILMMLNAFTATQKMHYLVFRLRRFYLYIKSKEFIWGSLKVFLLSLWSEFNINRTFMRNINHSLAFCFVVFTGIHFVSSDRYN